ncbi:hydroxyectoine utilization dehydratase EutB [Azospirillum rugosum]|uniref:Threonine dehydratase n=1 Tax=Azospirillum rugosum TaxID=416170 RepID=A0ABS4SJX3_9PROT|nr:hydroxyectoine utilization dehydratase EutB [Azospirillum rugosum]MBP2292860.1 threonine dehydratase [Azospirillum rugosum]MDQ0529388.1 threonine dehydratase [Azospirillum rugosum]
MADHGIGLEDVFRARARLSGRIAETPTVASPTLTERCGAPVFLKLETRQTTGSFKLRGATNALLALPHSALAKGVAAASTGNHGRALAFAAAQAGVRCVVCMSALVPANKVEGIRALGAEIRIVGRSQDDAQEEVDRLVREEGFATVPPFDDAGVIAGQGTLGLEIVEAVPDVDLVLVPLSGGGLIGGVALAVKALRPQARVVGVSMERGAAMHASLTAGKPVLVEELETLADSLGGGIGLANRHTFRLAASLLDGVVLLTEAEIAAGIRHAYTREQEIVEGAGAVGIAALLAGKIPEKIGLRGPTVALLSGRNIDMDLHRRIVCGDATGETACPA